MTGVTSKSLTGIQNALEQADHADAGGVRVERDLLGRLAQGGRGEVGVVRFGLAAREADLAAVVAVAAGALGQDDPGDAVVVRDRAGRGRRPVARPAGRRGPRRAQVARRRRGPASGRRPAPGSGIRQVARGAARTSSKRMVGRRRLTSSPSPRVAARSTGRSERATRLAARQRRRPARPGATGRRASARSRSRPSPCRSRRRACRSTRSASATIRSPGVNSPATMDRASGFSTNRWIVRLSGRAPNAGSVPSRTSSARAASVSSRTMSWLASRATRSATSRSTIRSRSASVSAWKTMISSTRLRNSGRKCEPSVVGDLALHLLVGGVAAAGAAGRDGRAADVAGHDDDRVLEVHGPALAVGQAAVVEDLEEDVEDVRVGLLDLVEQDDLVRPAADRLGQLAALLVADVAREARRRAATPRTSPCTRSCRCGPARSRRRT